MDVDSSQVFALERLHFALLREREVRAGQHADEPWKRRLIYLAVASLHRDCITLGVGNVARTMMVWATTTPLDALTAAESSEQGE